MPIGLAINEYHIAFILWNLLLMVIPFFLCWFLSNFWHRTSLKKSKHKIIAAFIFFLWLIFIPNAAYIIVDLRHISGYCENEYFRNCLSQSWVIPFFFIYASLGWVGFVLLINQMKALLTDIAGESTSRFFAPLVIPAISLGVLLGLVSRWNTWDIFISPLVIVQDAGDYFSNWPNFKNWLLFTIFFYFLFYFGDEVFAKKKINIKLKFKK